MRVVRFFSLFCSSSSILQKWMFVLLLHRSLSLMGKVKVWYRKQKKKTQQGKGSQKNGLFKMKNKNLKMKVKNLKQRAKVKSEKLLQSCILHFGCIYWCCKWLWSKQPKCVDGSLRGALTWLPILTTRWSYTPRRSVFAPSCRDCLRFLFCFLFESVKFNPARSAFVSRVCVRLF